MDTRSVQQIEELKCGLCKNSLSYFPIKIICENQQNICGRCSVSEDTIPNKTYETAAQFLQFPCCYKNEGCTEKKIPEEIPTHEKICLFQTVCCPIRKYTLCEWKGSLPNVLQHCKEQHPDLHLKNSEFELDLSESHHFESFLEHKEGFVITTNNFSSEDNKFQFSISYYKHAVDIKKIDYQLSFKNNNKCLLMDGFTNIFNRDEEDVNEIFLDSLKNQTSDQSKILVKIAVENTEHNLLSSEKQLNDEMLSQLKCSRCSDYIIPPIYQSDSLLVLWCGDCKANFFPGIGSRNLNLDKLASLLHYPCKYWKNGCTFISKPDEMVQHQKFCLKGIYDCPVNEYLKDCKWQGPGEDFATHLRQHHSDIMATNSSEITENYENSSKTTTASSLPLASNVFASIAMANSSPTTVTVTSKSSTNTSASPSGSPKYNFSYAFQKEKLVTSQNKAASKAGQPFNFLTGTTSPVFNFVSAAQKKEAISTEIYAACGLSDGKVEKISNTQNTTLVPLPTRPSTTDTITRKSVALIDSSVRKEVLYEKCYVISILNRLFRLSFAVKNDKFFWAVQTIGRFMEKFKYELEIIDKNDIHRRLVVKQHCSVISKKDEIFLNKRDYCSFSIEDIKLFLSPQMEVTFKVQIVK